MKKLLTTSAIALALAAIPAAAVLAHESPSASASPEVSGSPEASHSPSASSRPRPSFSPLVVSSNLPTPMPRPNVAKKLQPAHLAALKTRGAAEINRRIASLQKALAAIGATTKLTADTKATLTTQIQAEITGLQNLATKLAADTTLDDARTDVQSIFNEYRVYGLMLPKLQLMIAADRLALVGADFDTLVAKLQNNITVAKSKGIDTTAAEAALADLKSQLADAKTHYDGLAAKVIGLSPDDYNVNHSLLATYRNDLAASRADFRAARADVATIMKAVQPTASPEASPIASPAASPAATPGQ